MGLYSEVLNFWGKDEIKKYMCTVSVASSLYFCPYLKIWTPAF